METKVCSKCGEGKPLDQFYKGKGECKPCYNSRKKKAINDNTQTIPSNNKTTQNNTRKNYKELYETLQSEWDSLKIKYNALLEGQTIPDNTEQYQEIENNIETISDNTTPCILSLDEQEKLRELLKHKGTISDNTITISDNITTIPGNTKKQTFVVNMELLDKLNHYCKENRLTQSIVLNHLLNGFLK